VGAVTCLRAIFDAADTTRVSQLCDFADVEYFAAVAGTAGARIPEADSGGGGGTQARPAIVALTDAVDRAVQRNARTLGVQFAGPDAVARAIARRNR